MGTHTSSQSQTATPLTKNQWRGFFASWGGWALDGMDSYIFALVMVPALKELLPRSGLRSDLGGVGYYGGLLFALFLVGWGCAFLWGPVADKYGRVRTLMLTILWYSVFTFLCCISTRVWQLAVFRFLAGIGIGGEWAMGGTFVAEEWPEDRRKMAAGWMHTGYYVGFFLAAIANYGVGSRYGWRAMFALGGAPALLVSLIRMGVKESQKWQSKASEVKSRSLTRPLAVLFSPEYRQRTIVNSIYVLVSIIGLWAGSVYVPAAITEIVNRTKMPGRKRGACDFAGDNAAFRGDDSGMRDFASPGRTIGAASDAGDLFCVHAGIDCNWVRVCFLFAAGHAEMVSGVLGFSGAGRGEFRDVYVVAAGAIPDGVPGKRVCVCDLSGKICGGGIHVSGGGGSCAVSHDWGTGGDDVGGVFGGVGVFAVGV